VSLLRGSSWGVAHLPIYYWASADLAGALLPAVVAANVLAWFLPCRVLMLWVYDRTGESLLLAMLMHGSATGSPVIFASLAPGWPLFTFLLAFGAVVWVVVVAVALARGGHLSRQPPLRKRVA
jgi:uncharacterized protein